MLIEDSFTVRTPVDRLWAFIQDVERIAPCLPGAELTEVVDERTWKGKVHVKFGPVQLAFAGTVVMEERDDAAHRGRSPPRAPSSAARAWRPRRSSRGSSRRATTAPPSTSGRTSRSPARPRSCPEDSCPRSRSCMTKQFADCLEASSTEAEPSTPALAADDRRRTATAGARRRRRTPAPKPVGGFGLGLRALWASITGFFSRLFGRRPRS